jgi:hypothetical protein
VYARSNASTASRYRRLAAAPRKESVVLVLGGAHHRDDVRDHIEDDLRSVAHDVVAAPLGEESPPVRRGRDEIAMSAAKR